MRPRTTGGAVVLALALTVSVAACTAPLRNEYLFKGLTFAEPIPVPDFRLTNQDLQPVQLHDFRGKVVLLYFGFTHCPDACPMTMARWQAVARALGQDGDQIRFVLVTVDPERDTPARLKEYLGSFNPAFIGLTGSREQLEEVALSFQAFFRKAAGVAPGDYRVSHTALVHVLDPDGRLVLAFPPETAAPDMAADLRHLLQLARSGRQATGGTTGTILTWLGRAPGHEDHQDK